MVYVFNCSEQMDYKSVGNIYKGLAQSGSWGCFDEFNRISIDVLSVVAVQVKCIQDAVRNKCVCFNFLGEEISLNPTVGIFITMNPGYAGRTELPENLKALFRPCAMVVPDFELICEIMLVAEGFMEARLLARKFITLYGLAKELLSKQDHYDWGLRAIKSVLVVAGSLKRGDPTRPEKEVLMRALRDFNTPKIAADDLPVFMGLITDLFPSMDVPRKRDLAFEEEVRKAAVDLKLQPEENFILKAVQLQELLAVRHSVFILGNAGTGKSMIWRVLFRANQNLKQKPVVVDLDPKAVTNDELFGVINPATREWKDGLFSVVMRDLSRLKHDGPKWIMLDGDIDPMWIESLNTVMDDNKVLTLASNERIPLTPSMRLVFEIGHLKTATPATVSRAGILFVNPQDLGWAPYVYSWLASRDNRSEQANVGFLIETYVPICLEALRTRFKTTVPLVELGHVQTLCHLLEVHLTPINTPPDTPKEVYEAFFVFCAVWAFGGALAQDQLVDHRVEFSKWWIEEFKSVKFPATSNATVFDFYLDPETKKFEPWSKKVEQFILDPNEPLQTAHVSTTETARIRYFLNLLVAARRPVMLVGGAGTGKTVLVQNLLRDLGEDFLVVNVPLNFYTTSEMLQRVLEKPLEKKTGRCYGPPGNKRLIYFIDDLNMPEVDAYFTVQPHTLIRQHIDHSHWYDRAKLTLKEVTNAQYVTCMNPTAGSFTIDSRLQRHFAIFNISFPGRDAVHSIYNSILSQHLQLPSAGFPQIVQRLASSLTGLAVDFHSRITATFLPTALKFHYVFNLRDLTNIFQGLLFSKDECLKAPLDLLRLWIHETERVYADKLTDASDQTAFDKLLHDFVIKQFTELDVEESVIFSKPLLYCHFIQGFGDPRYLPVESNDTLEKLLNDALVNYNEMYAAMNLVLFEDAIEHVLRIDRILESPRGNALLVGIGGSGKQSLSRLAAFISSLEVFQIVARKGYSVTDLKADLAALYRKAGLKNVGTVFLLTDAQVLDEKFLVIINYLLASGEIPDLFADDEEEEIISAIQSETRAAGILDTRENCWQFFINKVRRTLKVILCFSPVGPKLRMRARRFPALVNCTTIDWFHEWPEEALLSVSKRFVSEISLLDPALCEPISTFMSHVHKTVNDVSRDYLTNEKRYNYTTPKSFLEQIHLYENMLNRRDEEIRGNIARLENGLQKLESTAQQVDDLKAKLATQEVALAEKNEDANKLLAIVSAETEKVVAEKAVADEEEKKVAKIRAEVAVRQRECEVDLAKAEPALVAAQEALNTLNKSNLTEMKSFGTPPPAVVKVVAAVACLLAPQGRVPKDRSWKAAKAGMMSKIDQFLDNLINYDKENMHENSLKAVAEYLKDPEFDPNLVRSKSLAAAGLCSWAINIVKFHEVFCVVKPKRDALDEANKELQGATEALDKIREKIGNLESKLAELTVNFENAKTEKQKCQDEADNTKKTIDLANRLVGGLASEKLRWSQQIEEHNVQASCLPGDVLITAAFLSYLGYFTKKYRSDLLDKLWMPFLKTLQPAVPITPDLDPLSLLVDDALVAKWSNEGLPSDRFSVENTAILTSAERWPLLIDPQLQGIKWIKTRYAKDLKVLRLGQKGYLDVIEKAISEGAVVLIENIDLAIDPVLEPLIGRNTIRRGTAIRLGGKEIDYNPGFKLILQTKLGNPHYAPELQAQTTLINFTVTRDGLEDQLLANVVRRERPDLENLKSDLTRQQNEFKITLKSLEDALLAKLSEAEGNFLGNYALVENLETNKRTAAEIQGKVQQAKVTEAEINTAREIYRPACERAAILYFIVSDLNKVNPIYQFSLKAFGCVFDSAMTRAETSEDVKSRVTNIINSVTYSVYVYTSRGLFEKDKLLFTAQVAFQVCQERGEVNAQELDYLLRFPVTPNVTSPVDFITTIGWGAIKALTTLKTFNNLDSDIEGSAKRWKKVVDSEKPENERLPQEWKNKTHLQRLCILRALRPDRMLYAIRNFVSANLGKVFTEGSSLSFSESFDESGPATPIFFILSPGVDPLKDVEALGRQIGFTSDRKNFHNISLGQGQESVAEETMKLSAHEGHWIILQNVHLVAKWLPAFEKLLEELMDGAHENYRVFISAEPASSPEFHVIPQGVLENSIKITNEPPTGMQANIHKALNNFTQATLEMSIKEYEFKMILFTLCYFHAVVCERRRFGPQGWNRVYPFNTGDLTISVDVLYNYLEVNNDIPWEGLRYLFGEIMYGGHITDDWDRRLCKTYLEEYITTTMMDGDHSLAPGFKAPPNSDMAGFHKYVDANLPPESPYLYGMHPNTEIDILTVESEKLFRRLLEMMPRESKEGEQTDDSLEKNVQTKLEDILGRLPEPFNMQDLHSRVPPGERTPFAIVALQECDRMNILLREILRSLKELSLGLKGELTISPELDALQNALFFDTVPKTWTARAYPSLYPLGLWYADLIARARDLEIWVTDFESLPSAIWLGGLFNPQSFLTAIMQQMSRKNEWPLDRVTLNVDVTRKTREELTGPPRDGAFVHSLFVEGARWDTQTGLLAEAKPKELVSALPIVFIKAVPVDKQDTRGTYACPVYKTKSRGPTYVWTFNLKTRVKPANWVLGGVAIILQF
ncbi:dynein beta chain ciliary [Echinococcus multilocularis]|uniref:Dynein beta chain ciliary n=1 Tax=Echinococcus multilocularis TaxID=6211 RepID=A0A068Y2T2_ECHMU|nr:dynein beta chain ciliary [Echinococcus multilocularis]